MCNQFRLEIRAILHKVLPLSALAHFTTMILLRGQNFQNTTLPISAQCALYPLLRTTSMMESKFTIYAVAVAIFHNQFDLTMSVILAILVILKAPKFQ